MDELKAKLERQMKQLDESLRGIEDRRSSSNNGVSTITVNAGGVGVWACLTACIMMISMMLIGGMWMSREFNRIDREMTDRREGMERMQTYLSAIYAQAPHLKPKEEENAK